MFHLSLFPERITRYLPVLLLLSVAFSSRAQVIVSELYRDPPGTESDANGGGASHEFIELTNLGPDSCSIENLYLTNGIEADSITPETDTIAGHENCLYNHRSIPPGVTALVLDPDYRTAVTTDSTCAFNLPDSTLLLRCGDAKFASGGLAATHGIVIYRGSKSSIDTVICSAVNPGETLSSPKDGKIELSSPDNIEGVSMVAVNVLSADMYYDYCPTSISPGLFEPLRSGWVAEFHLGRFNRSTGAVPCTTLVLSTRQRNDATQPWRCLRTFDGASTLLLSGNLSLSGRRGTTILSLPADSAAFSFTLHNDDRPSWPIDLSIAWLPESAILITEISPKANLGEPEWFELKNTAPIPIDLRNWRYGKNDDTVTITPVSFVLLPDGYTVVTRNADSLAVRYRSLPPSITPRHWITLDNSVDTIVLYDARGTVRETVCYDDARFSDWPYTSIERSGHDDGCGGASWSVASRPTPGLPNEASYWRDTDAPALDIGPIPFTPDNDGKNDLFAIHLRLPAASGVTITVYGFDGRAVKTFSGQPQEVLYWDGRTATGSAAPPGPFFVVAEIKDGGATKRLRKKGILWRRR